MAIRKPTPPAPKSEAMAQLLASGAGQTKTIQNGKIVEGTIKVVKGNDVFVDIGYKSEGKVDLDEFPDPAAVKPGEVIQVLVRELENEKTGMVSLSKKAADIQIRWEKVLEQYTEGCVVTGTIKALTHGGLLVDIDGFDDFNFQSGAVHFLLQGDELFFRPIDTGRFIQQTHKTGHAGNLFNVL